MINLNLVKPKDVALALACSYHCIKISGFCTISVHYCAVASHLKSWQDCII